MVKWVYFLLGLNFFNLGQWNKGFEPANQSGIDWPTKVGSEFGLGSIQLGLGRTNLVISKRYPKFSNFEFERLK